MSFFHVTWSCGVAHQLRAFRNHWSLYSQRTPIWATAYLFLWSHGAYRPTASSESCQLALGQHGLPSATFPALYTSLCLLHHTSSSSLLVYFSLTFMAPNMQHNIFLSKMRISFSSVLVRVKAANLSIRTGQIRVLQSWAFSTVGNSSASQIIIKPIITPVGI